MTALDSGLTWIQGMKIFELALINAIKSNLLLLLLGEFPQNPCTKVFKAAVASIGGSVRGVSYPLSINPCLSYRIPTNPCTYIYI